MAEAKTKAAPKVAAKKAAAKKAPAKAKKAPAKKRPAAKTKAKVSTKAKTRARPKAIDTGRNALLAGLGVYGKAYDQVLEQFANLQEQVDEAQTRLTERRKQAEDLYKSLIKRGTAVEKEALKALADLELDSLADRSKLEAQMKKAKSRFDDLKTKFGKAAYTHLLVSVFFGGALLPFFMGARFRRIIALRLGAVHW